MIPHVLRKFVFLQTGTVYRHVFPKIVWKNQRIHLLCSLFPSRGGRGNRGSAALPLPGV